MNPLAPIIVAVGILIGWTNAHALVELRQAEEQATVARNSNAHALVRLRAAEDARPTDEAPTVQSAATPASPADPGGGGLIEWRPEVERWRSLVSLYFQPADVEHALAVIRCESVGDPDAVNPSSGTGGMFQHRPEYWPARSTAAGWAGADVMDPEANVAVAAWLVYRGGGWGHWSGRAWGVDSCEEYACAQGVC